MIRLQGAIIALVVSFAATSATAATFTLELKGGAACTDIRAAIDAAKAGEAMPWKQGACAIAESVAPEGRAITPRSEAGTRQAIRVTTTEGRSASAASLVIGETERSGVSETTEQKVASPRRNHGTSVADAALVREGP